MKSIILKTATTYLLPLLLLFSIFILLRGHYNSGGGFVGGLITSIAFVLYSFANDIQSAKSMFKYVPGFLIPTGLTLSVLSGFFPLLLGKPFLTSIWYPETIGIIGSLGTTLFFDIGVYFVVIGVTLTILFTISESL
ncbi:MAG TPA: Na+/H+ antiporter subunit B [Chitinophagales bacterium]|nr:Na+/H+ antiporter subunit B [Chitinophagales bacterium]